MSGYDPRQQRPATPPQWQGQDRLADDQWRRAAEAGQAARLGAQQYPRQQQPPPVFPPGYQGQPGAQGYWPPQYQPPQMPPPHRSWARRHKVLTALLSLAGLIVVIVVATSAGSHSTPPQSSSAPPAAQGQAAAPAKPAAKTAPKKAAAQTVTYVVTGSAADVTYGPAGTDLAGTVPMRVSKPLGTPIYYSVTAQLQGGGSVSCQILVDGKAISSSTASGGYNIAQCEIGQDPLSGQWQDDNG